MFVVGAPPSLSSSSVLSPNIYQWPSFSGSTLMASILDLPREIVALIITQLARRTDEWFVEWHRDVFLAETAGRLRLVCRKWADWLYEDHLYRTLRFKSASRSLAFIEHLRKRSELLPHARCQHLTIKRIWPSSHLTRKEEESWNIPSIVEPFVHLFFETIVTLELEFTNSFELPIKCIRSIQRLDRLQNLHLSFLKWGYEKLPTPSTHCLNTLLVGARGLKSLRLALPVSLPRRFGFPSGYPSITHLHVDPSWQTPEVILDLAISLKSSLRVLAIQHANRPFDPESLLPIYATLREVSEETLEGLAVTRDELLTPIFDFKFPKLKTITIQCWGDSLGELFKRDIFAHAPIESLGVSYSIATSKHEVAFEGDLFANLPKLQRLVFMAAKSDPKYPLSPNLLSACEARRIECVYLDHNTPFLLMVGPII
ncbi:hypothetical protein MJO29_005288 [Puccinia striiformis f. sp. tritici]|nr:hypothetical protein MJO29_005288 [Puccinia striiformis f. sp. tritici]